MADIVSTAIFRAQADTNSARRDWNAFGGAMKSVGVGVAGALLGVAAAGAAVSLAMAKFAADSQRQEVVFTRLRTAVEQTGTAYSDVADDLSEFFAERQRFTTFGDDATADLTASLISLTAASGATIEEVRDLTSLAQDMSVALGIDARQAADVLARAHGGNTEALGRLLPAHRELLRELAKNPDVSARASVAIGLVSEQFSGAAMNVDGYTLAVSRLGNGFGDLREAIGDTVTQSAAIREALSAAADTLDSFVGTISSGTAEAENFRRIVGDAFVFTARGAITAASATLKVADALIGTTRAAAELLRITGSGDSALEQQQRDLSEFIALSERALDQSASIDERASARVAARRLAGSADLGQLDTSRIGAAVPRGAENRALQQAAAQARQLEQQIGMGRGSDLEGATSLTSFVQSTTAALDALDRRLAAGPFGADGPDGGSGASAGAGVQARTAARAAEVVEVAKLVDLLAGAAAEEEKARAAFLARKEEIEAGVAAISQTATGAASSFASAVSSIFGDFAEGSAAISQQIAEKTAENNAMLVEEHMNFVRSLSADTFAVINGGMMDLVSTTVDGFAAMVIAGESAGSALGGPLLKSLGNIAKQMGTVFLTASGGLTALFSLSPAGLAVAGGALLLVGATLGALGGVVSSKGKGGAPRGPVGDSGLRGMATQGAAQSTQTIVDARGAVFVSDDPATTRSMIRRLDEGRARGGSGRV